jgi:hypothetical protein
VRIGREFNGGGGGGGGDRHTDAGQMGSNLHLQHTGKLQ